MYCTQRRENLTYLKEHIVILFHLSFAPEFGPQRVDAIIDDFGVKAIGRLSSPRASVLQRARHFVELVHVSNPNTITKTSTRRRAPGQSCSQARFFGSLPLRKDE